MNVLSVDDPQNFVDTSMQFARDNFPIFDTYVEDKGYLLDQDDQSIEPSTKEIYLKAVDLLVDAIMTSYGLTFYTDEIRTETVTNVYESHKLMQLLSMISLESLNSIYRENELTIKDFLEDIWENVGRMDPDVTFECTQFLRDIFYGFESVLSGVDQRIRFNDNFVVYLKRSAILCAQSAKINTQIKPDGIQQLITSYVRLMSGYTDKIQQYIIAGTAVYFHNNPATDSHLISRVTAKLLTDRMSASLILLNPSIADAIVPHDGRYIIDKDIFSGYVESITLGSLLKEQYVPSAIVLSHILISITFQLAIGTNTDFQLRYIPSKWYEAILPEVIITDPSVENGGLTNSLLSQLIKVLKTLEDKNNNKLVEVNVNVGG